MKLRIKKGDYFISQFQSHYNMDIQIIINWIDTEGNHHEQVFADFDEIDEAINLLQQIEEQNEDEEAKND